MNDQKRHDFLGGLMCHTFCMVGKPESLPSNIWCRGLTFHQVKNREEHHLKGNLGDLPVYTKLPFLQHGNWDITKQVSFSKLGSFLTSMTRGKATSCQTTVTSLQPFYDPMLLSSKDATERS